MSMDYVFKDEDMAVDEGLGYPKAYAKLCRDRGAGPYSVGPPFSFTCYTLQQHEAMRASELEQMFPINDPKAKPKTNPKIFLGILWKQLNHLGNAGFDPAVIRIDPYGNVLYYHADSASPLAWDFDHWFPCSRGGLTVPNNLRILQWQVCKKKHNKLEFLVPWWDLQLGLSVNQFLSIFASSNSDFSRHRGFSFLFAQGENEELNDSQTIESHCFPQHFSESKKLLGLAPAAIVVSRREPYDPLSSDYNRCIRPHYPTVAARRVNPTFLKENEDPDFVRNPYKALVMARDSLKQREETQKMQEEIQKLDEEVNEMRTTNDEEKLAIQDLELTLIKRRRRAEKCRRLAEAQSSYRNVLEKMIRDAMHQSVVYKEQVRLSQAANNALMARLEAQKAICDASEKELHMKFKQREDLEKQIRPGWEQARKRSRTDDTLFDERDSKTVLYLPGNRPKTPRHKELRVYLDEEHKASRACLSLKDYQKQNEIEKDLRETEESITRQKLGAHHNYQKQNEIEKDLRETEKSITRQKLGAHHNSIVASGNEVPIEKKLQALEIGEVETHRFQFPDIQEPETEEDEESRKQRGKGNVERWLQMLLDNSQEELDPQDMNQKETRSETDDIIAKMNLKYPQKEAIKLIHLDSGDKEGTTQDHGEKQQQPSTEEENKGKKEVITDIEDCKILQEKTNISAGEGIGRCKSIEGYGKERRLERSESISAFRRLQSSPSLILGMKKGVDCIRKKPTVIGDDDGDENRVMENRFMSPFRRIKNSVKF
ncbi:hypothetical protein CFOL_v3_12680 [Cephalotus follicularis]|uniref:Uncharacterized protein n=1 Tax=Cephalotus follicularis TaxID=3775 RepID=A0A1Q3BMS6_CEPFO|nr:hypothetical protein CFOL_v3_12680 [Cephalotus follicularis]